MNQNNYYETQYSNIMYNVHRYLCSCVHCLMKYLILIREKEIREIIFFILNNICQCCDINYVKDR